MRNLKVCYIILILLGGVVLLSCGGSDDAKKAETASYLTKTFGKTNISRSGEPQTYVGQSLFEYINGGAEIYHMYHFVDVATASYDKDGTEIVADIYRFENSRYAFGLYTTIRPDERQAVDLGVEGFASETTVDFVVGEFVLKVFGYEQTPETKLAVSVIAAELEKSLPGPRSRPEIYSVLPIKNKIDGTEKMYAASFLGIKGLDEMYSCTYAVGSDTVEIFIAKDGEGKLFSLFKANSVSDVKATSIASGLPFSAEACAVTLDPYYGNIVAGTKAELFVGAIGYGDNMKLFFNNWVDSLN